MRVAAFILFLCAMALMSLAEGVIVTCVALVLCAAGAALVANRQLGEAAREAEEPEVSVSVYRWNY